MINKNYLALGTAPSSIRALFQYGLNRKAEIGADKVFDFSLGNPNVPTPQPVLDALADIAIESRENTAAAVALHGYTPAPGAMNARKAVADNLNGRFAADMAQGHGVAARPQDVYMTVGAAPSLLLSFSAISNPGDEIVVIAPYFPEYRVWIEQVGCTCVEVPADAATFQPDVEALAAAINERTAALIINTPNNPVGAVYTRESLEALAAMLEAKSAEIGHDIFLITDEPYRELTYGAEVTYVPSLYAHTLMCYSFSKSFSLPGERIGYVFVPAAYPEAADVFAAVAGAGRALAFVCAPSIWQEVIARTIDTPADVAPYAKNREALMTMLADLGYEFIQPDGAFYLWMKALEPDAQAFSDRAKAHELLLVPSNSFGVTGWVRISYCVAYETIVNSRDAFAALMAEYQA